MILLPVFANHRPLYINYKSEHFFPALSGKDIMQSGPVSINLQLTDFKVSEDAFVIMPIFPWSPGRSDLMNAYSGPFDEQHLLRGGIQQKMPFYWRHWLGTDGKGADVLVGIFYGFRYSMIIACLAVLIAALPGILLGSCSGYFGNDSLKVKVINVVAFIISIIYFIAVAGVNIIFPFVISLLIYSLIILLFKKIFPGFYQKEINLAIDSLLMRIMEVMVSIPGLIVIITLAAIVHAGIITLAIIMGILMWPEVVRFTRGQVLQIKNQDYILASKALGFTDSRIIMKHLLPNAITPVFILLCFAFSNVILTEAGLSFLGIGISQDVVSWGSLLASGRENFDAWWLVVFPGLMLTLVVYFLISVADRYQLQHKSKFLIKKAIV
jgi:peptide/nickel transport system permease protein